MAFISFYGRAESVCAPRATAVKSWALAAVAVLGLVGPALAGSHKKPTCGNNVAESKEVCDGTDLRGQSCTSRGFAGGWLACSAVCELDESGCSADRFVDNADGTVVDTKTGLQWEKKDGDDGVPNVNDPHDVDNLYTWGNLAGCLFVGCPNGSVFTDFLGRLNHSLRGDDGTIIVPGFAGHSDWRLPTEDELASLVDLNFCHAPDLCLDLVLQPAANLTVSATTGTIPNYGEYAWGVYFATGYKPQLPKVSPVPFRAVRTF